MAVDLCFKGTVDEALARHASRLGYRAIAVCGIDSFRDVGGLRLVPRFELARSSVDRYRKSRGLRVLLVRSRDDLKAYPKLAGSVDSVRILFDDLGEADKGFWRRVISLGAPVEVEFSELLQRIIDGSPVDYYYLLFRLYARGKVRIYMCSGAADASTLVHPTAMSALASVLGVPEALALKAVLKTPGELVPDAA